MKFSLDTNVTNVNKSTLKVYANGIQYLINYELDLGKHLQPQLKVKTSFLFK